MAKWRTRPSPSPGRRSDTVPPTRLEAAKQVAEAAVNAYADRAGMPPAAAAKPAAPAGPVVRVTRGKNTVEEQVGR